MLVDRATIIVRGGRGGDGHVSFARFKYIPKGGPDGGDGGNGGSVRLVATSGVDTLLDLTGKHHWSAQDGQPGGIKQCAGRDGEDLDIRIPPGTLVYDDVTGELLGDLDEPGKSLVVAKGGRGGFGNEHFKSPTHQAPREHTPGEPAEERTLRLELKLIADIGIVGKPNAGKSTLLSRISRAKPKIANYPFTTLEPNLGIVELPGSRRMVVADIPGLIEGAHEGKGLGTEFLRHVERTRLLVHLLEIEPGDGSDPVENHRVINHELAGYSPELALKPQIIAVSKMDLLPTQADRRAAKALLEEAVGTKVFPISAASGDGIETLLEACWVALLDCREAESRAKAKSAIETSLGDAAPTTTEPQAPPADQAPATPPETATRPAKKSSGKKPVVKKRKPTSKAKSPSRSRTTRKAKSAKTKKTARKPAVVKKSAKKTAGRRKPASSKKKK